MKGSARATVVELVQRQLAESSINAPVSADANLMEAGLNSIDVLNLVLSLEAEFDLMMPESEIRPENVLTIAALTRLVERLVNGR
ncbi:MAG: phosphopantetheine-binding protein [Candidatus Binataceae bacterium]|jgi:acyl carrier protein